MNPTPIDELSIRAEEFKDLAGITQLIIEAFGQADEVALVDALRASTAWIPDLSLVAASGDEVIGHVAFTRLQIGSGTGLALAPLSVSPARQKIGVGAALVNAGLARAAQLGYSTVVVLGDDAYYGRFGFVRAALLGVGGPFGDIKEFQVVALGQLPTLTGSVKYPEAFGI